MSKYNTNVSPIRLLRDNYLRLNEEEEAPSPLSTPEEVQKVHSDTGIVPDEMLNELQHFTWSRPASASKADEDEFIFDDDDDFEQLALPCTAPKAEGAADEPVATTATTTTTTAETAANVDEEFTFDDDDDDFYALVFPSAATAKTESTAAPEPKASAVATANAPVTTTTTTTTPTAAIPIADDFDYDSLLDDDLDLENWPLPEPPERPLANPFLRPQPETLKLSRPTRKPLSGKDLFGKLTTLNDIQKMFCLNGFMDEQEKETGAQANEPSTSKAAANRQLQ